MKWDGDQGCEQVPAWSYNPDSMRWKPHSASQIQSHHCVHKGIIGILHVYSI